MKKEQFESRIKELLPQTTEPALRAWTEYIQSLEKRKSIRQAICLTASMWNCL